MMDAGRHPNITLLSYSEVEKVSGYVGNFQVQVRRKPRYVLEDTTTRAHRATWDYDCLFTTDPSIWLKWANVRYGSREEWVKALGFEAHGIAREPNFVDPAGGDFHLRPESPCIDAGVRIPNINDDFAGTAPDIGCFEYHGLRQAQPALSGSKGGP
jgi:hypothetical protein